MFNFNNLTRITKGLLIINVVIFAITNLFNTEFFYQQLSAYYPASPFFKAWQVVTHMFMHAGLMHILFNMIGLMSFGPALERVLGEKKFFFFYFACGFGAFALYNLVNFYQVQQLMAIVESGVDTSFAEQSLAIIYGTPMVGASGAIFGVVTAFAILYPDAKLIIMPIPIPVKAKYILTLVIVGSIYLGIKQMSTINSGDNIAHFAHLGGALVGFIYMMIWKRNRFRIN